MSLYEKLAEAYAQPSQNYRNFQAGIQGANSAIDTIGKATALREEMRKRKLEQQTLAEALGNNVPESVAPYGGMNVSTLKNLGGLDAIAKLGKTTTDPMTMLRLRQEAIDKRQNKQQEFIRSMVGAKGNKDAVNQAKNAAQGLDFVDKLWESYDKLGDTQKSLAGTPVFEKMFPTINTYKQNIVRTAGFAEGGKALTGPERGIIVNSFLPTTYETPESRSAKKQIARAYYLGTIDLFEAAKLLGPAGQQLLPIAQAQHERMQKEGLDTASKVSGMMNMGGGNELDNIFGSEGLNGDN